MLRAGTDKTGVPVHDRPPTCAEPVASSRPPAHRELIGGLVPRSPSPPPGRRAAGRYRPHALQGLRRGGRGVGVMVGWRARVVPPLAVAVLVGGMAVIPALRDPRFYLTDDSAAQFLPSWYHLGRLLRAGQFPLLDPTLWAGGNIAAEALFGVWNPVLLGTMLFVSATPDLVVASVVVKAFFLVLLALGVYGLAREY